MRVLVTGSRDWKDRDLLFQALSSWQDDCGITEIIEGCARGADRLAEAWAAEMDVPVSHYPADWNTLGKKAGPLRNIQMLKTEPDIVFAFHDDLRNSAGTGHMVKIAERAGLRVILISHEQV